MHKSDHWHRRRLRARCERPDSRTAKQRDEIPAPIIRSLRRRGRAASSTSDELKERFNVPADKQAYYGLQLFKLVWGGASEQDAENLLQRSAASARLGDAG
jgi:hypothetical protein